MTSQPIRIELTCHHTLRLVLPPSAGATLWCRMCVDYVKVAPRESHCQVRCLSCSMTALLGTDDGAAARMAVRHVNRYPTHTAVLSVGTDSTEIRNPNPPEPPGTGLRELRQTSRVFTGIKI
jgi:hypothetical protein